MFFQELQDFMQARNRVFAYEIFSIKSQEKAMQKHTTLKYNRLKHL